MSLPEIENIYMKIKKILGYIFTVASRKLERKKGYFELYGCDFIFDENLNPFLMDISSNPSLLIGKYIYIIDFNIISYRNKYTFRSHTFTYQESLKKFHNLFIIFKRFWSLSLASMIRRIKKTFRKI